MKSKRLISVMLGIALMIGVLTACNKTQDAKEFDFTPDPTVKSTSAETVSATEAPAAPTHGYSVSCSSDIATDVAMKVLADGGNAADAAVALSYTLAVVEHYASGLGGSGGLLIYDPSTDKCDFYDYRACSGSDGYSAIGVPGFVKGMEALHDDYGTVSMQKLIEPAATYAENGFEVNGTLANRIAGAAATLMGQSAFTKDNGNLVGKGDTLVQSELGATLRLIQRDGSDAFYKGPIAMDIAESTQLTFDDLANYKVNKSAAVKGSFNGYTIYGTAAPLSGVVVIQMLEMAEMLGIADPETDAAGYIDMMSKVTSIAYSDRYYTITDPDFYDENVDFEERMQELVSEEYVSELLGIGKTDAANYDSEKPETTSYSIVDKNGMIVCSTNTLSSFWGSQLSVDGFFLNNTNYNFSSHGINAYESNKRSRTYTAPTIIIGEGGYELAVGSPGGNNIPGILFNVIVDVLKFGEDPQPAVDKSRFLYRYGALTIEVDSNGSTWLDLSGIDGNYVWHDSGYWWGSVSFAGYSDKNGAFAAYDFRRGATKAGVWNPEEEK